MANVLPEVAPFGPIAIVLLLARMLVGAVQLMSAWLLFAGRPPATPFATAALASSATLAALEFGCQLAPSNQEPTYRWYFVGAYAVYSSAWIAFLRRRSAPG